MTLRPFSANLQKSFRDTLGTPGSPTLIEDETPVQAVAVIATAGTTAIGVSTPSSNQTHINVRNLGTGSMQTAYTVTTGKTFWLYGANLEGSATPGTLQFYETTGTTRVLMFGGTSPAQFGIGGGCPIAKYTSGQLVKAICTLNYEFTFWGIEE